jgi:hypothetical protein
MAQTCSPEKNIWTYYGGSNMTVKKSTQLRALKLKISLHQMLSVWSNECGYWLVGSLFNDVFSVTRLYSDDMMKSEWRRPGKDFVQSGRGLILRYCNVSAVLFTMELYCTPKTQHTTINYSQPLFEHTYTTNLYGLGTLIPIQVELYQQDLLWQSSNTNLHSCSQKVSKYTSGQSIVGLSVHLHTTTAPRRIVHH